jgi:hypothetical protein
MFARAICVGLGVVLATASGPGQDIPPGGDATEREAGGDTPPPEPERTDLKTLREGLERYAAPVVAVRPGRLAPGQNGELHLILALQGSTVLRPDGHFRLDYASEQGPVSLGGWTPRPPAPATLAKAFAGQAVYDNTMVVVVPIAVAADAPHGPARVTLTVESDVFDGDSGELRGRFGATAQGDVTIGAPLPKPIPQARAAAPGPSVPGGATGGSTTTRIDDREGVRTAPVAGIDAREPDADPDVVAPDRPTSPSALPGGQGSIIWIGAGSGVVILLLVLAMLVRRN